ncbi:hypothetical protein KUK83_000152 [Vibrio parahaemolyticus]|nr:hypothetical protein [Vibrio parahaemolyticus]EKB3552968.1 hypothetical protein [Vibrio parahaemolyticus]
MNIRSKLSQQVQDKPAPEKLPYWVIEGSNTTKKLYEAAYLEYISIKEKIESGKAKNSRETKLIPARIAAHANLARSNLHPRRQYELCQWIKNKNEELATLNAKYEPRRLSVPPKSKRELQRELSQLRTKYRQQTEDERRKIVEEFFRSNMLDDRNQLQRENYRLKLQNKQLSEKVARLQASARESDQLIGQLMELLPPEQRIHLKVLPHILEEKSQEAD